MSSGIHSTPSPVELVKADLDLRPEIVELPLARGHLPQRLRDDLVDVAVVSGGDDALDQRLVLGGELARPRGSPPF